MWFMDYGVQQNKKLPLISNQRTHNKNSKTKDIALEIQALAWNSVL
jgi:hypothetical protein